MREMGGDVDTFEECLDGMMTQSEHIKLLGSRFGQNKQWLWNRDKVLSRDIIDGPNVWSRPNLFGHPRSRALLGLHL
jgi:hypothetical protein